MSMPALFPHGSSRTFSLATAAFVALVTLAGCSVMEGASKFVDPYKHDVVQGNFVSREQVDALQPGMSRQQVRDILGTPLLSSIFHGDRWEYVFRLERRGAETQKYRMTVHFKGDTLARFEGDTMPTEAEFVSRFDPINTVNKVPVLQASDEALSKFPPSVSSVMPQPAPAGRSSYPPLEGPAP
jgi:outer membrane protein assembly factor BamE